MERQMNITNSFICVFVKDLMRMAFLKTEMSMLMPGLSTRLSALIIGISVVWAGSSPSQRSRVLSECP